MRPAQPQLLAYATAREAIQNFTGAAAFLMNLPPRRCS
ncbi:MAG: hypothetical protein JWO83_4009 [Caulobacteraceae bacterium]|nr:hypothetical protein [Caulobacteraceae bacterium]